MKTNRTILIAAAALMLASCADKAKISGTLDGVHNGQLTVKQLDVNKFTILDTIKTNGEGNFNYSVPVKKGQPEFVYLFTRTPASLPCFLKKENTLS